MTPRTDQELEDFSCAGCQVKLQWRDSNHPFWTVSTPSLGPFHPSTEIHVDAAKAVRDAVVELEARLAGLSYEPEKDRVARLRREGRRAA